MMTIMRQYNNNFRKNDYPTYQFIPYFRDVSSVVSSVIKLIQYCIQRFKGVNDEKNIVYKGGWF